MKKLSILIADDAPDVCSLLAHWLRAHHTACVHTGSDALTALTLLHFDLVITDIHMPDVSGLDVIRRLKQSQPWVKVLAISGGSRYLTAAAGVDQATEIGADGVILKPFDEERLLMRVKACWDGADEASRIEISERAALSVELGV
jgi:CheY-like chemotaxis protein